MSKRNRKELDNEEYEVERILGTRVVDGVEEVYVKWKGYSSRHNTWEPKENIRTCIYESASETDSTKPLSKRSKSSSDENTKSNLDSEKENNVKSTKSSRATSRRRAKKNDLPPKQIKLRIVKKDEELTSETLFEHKPPEIEKIVGKRIRSGDCLEYLIQFKNLSAKHNIWEPAENKDIQEKIAEYEAQLVKEKVNSQTCKQEPLEENDQITPTDSLGIMIKDSKMKRVSLDIFENDSTILLVKDENNFVQLDKFSDKYSFCQAVLNVSQIFHNIGKDKK